MANKANALGQEKAPLLVALIFAVGDVRRYVSVIATAVN